ncbi:hypothetical protein [Methylobacterium platani]|uniref:hypothetical protein n=1 Tax=Methylobacterium platani TaxID=427683 RepID=UPI000AB59EED|nr:hypothetical protein [Methylobacterium platani]
MLPYDSDAEESVYAEAQARSDFKLAVLEILIVKKKAYFDFVINMFILLACVFYFVLVVENLDVAKNNIMKIISGLPIISIVPLGGMIASLIIMTKSALLRHRADLMYRYFNEEWSNKQ